ncbi:hypothetical protein Z051_03655 [Rhodococcus rhodochrous KG-21]|uniref:Uncharacterized protein n=1 Tax=Rhodococcus rhodochrous KG-21 TaxID=1441923 RepID=A0A0M8PLV2_RHORH|nr:hypothetical protein Z051_03655 [Rhodococcus rhodochrous KG-21]
MRRHADPDGSGHFIEARAAWYDSYDLAVHDSEKSCVTVVATAGLELTLEIFQGRGAARTSAHCKIWSAQVQTVAGGGLPE